VVDFAQVDEDLVLPVFRRAPDADHLPHLAIPLDRSFIVATAIATRDYQPVHHDPDHARNGGSEDVFMNILTSQGLVGRYITDWAGPDAIVRKIAIRLGASNYPGDTMVMTGTVTARSASAAGEDLEVTVVGRNRRGEHIKGTVALTVPARAGGLA